MPNEITQVIHEDNIVNVVTDAVYSADLAAIQNIKDKHLALLKKKSGDLLPLFKSQLGAFLDAGDRYDKAGQDLRIKKEMEDIYNVLYLLYDCIKDELKDKKITLKREKTSTRNAIEKDVSLDEIFPPLPNKPFATTIHSKMLSLLGAKHVGLDESIALKLMQADPKNSLTPISPTKSKNISVSPSTTQIKPSLPMPSGPRPAISSKSTPAAGQAQPTAIEPEVVDGYLKTRKVTAGKVTSHVENIIRVSEPQKSVAVIHNADISPPATSQPSATKRPSKFSPKLDTIEEEAYKPPEPSLPRPTTQLIPLQQKLRIVTPTLNLAGTQTIILPEATLTSLSSFGLTTDTGGSTLQYDKLPSIFGSEIVAPILRSGETVSKANGLPLDSPVSSTLPAVSASLTSIATPSVSPTPTPTIPGQQPKPTAVEIVSSELTVPKTTPVIPVPPSTAIENPNSKNEEQPALQKPASKTKNVANETDIQSEKDTTPELVKEAKPEPGKSTIPLKNTVVAAALTLAVFVFAGPVAAIAVGALAAWAVRSKTKETPKTELPKSDLNKQPAPQIETPALEKDIKKNSLPIDPDITSKEPSNKSSHTAMLKKSRQTQVGEDERVQIR